jgi:translocation and assembly module TamB
VPELAPFAELAATDLAAAATITARLDGQGRRLVLRMEGAPSAAGIALSELALTLTAEADSALASLPEQVRFALEGGLATPAVEGLDTADLLGPRLALSAAGSVAPETGEASVDRIALDSAGIRAEGGAGFTGGNRLTPTLTVSAADLGRFSDVAGLDLSGGVELIVDGTVDLDLLDVSLTLALTGSELGLGDPALGDLVGTSPALIGGIALGPDDRLHLVDLTLDAGALQAGGDASLDLGSGAIDGRIDLAAPDLSVLSAIAGTDLAGAAAVAVALGGTLESPAASASWRIVRLAVAGTEVEETTGSVTATGLPDTPSGAIRAKASLRGEPVDLAVDYALAGGVLTLRALSLDGLGAEITGDVAVDLETVLARGDLAIAAPGLAPIGSALDLPLAAGSLRGAVRVTDTDGQGASISLDLTGLALDDGTEVERAYLEASLADVTGAVGGRLDLWTTNAESGGLALKAATLGADMRGGVADLTLNAEGDAGVPVVLAVAATVPLDPAEGPITVRRLDADLGDVAVRQRGPMRVALQPAARIDGIDLAVDDGRVSGHVGLDTVDLDIAIAIRDLPAALARLADPTLELEGRIDGDIAVSGPIGNPTADFALSTAGIRTLEPDLADLPPLVADLVLGLSDRKATARVAASIGDGATARFAADIDGSAGPAGSPPVFEPSAPLDAQLDADMDLARVSAFLPLDLVALAGNARARVTAGGTAGSPELAGAVTVDQGDVDVPSAGLYLRDLTVRAEGEGRKLVIRRFDARAAGGGTLSVSGSLSADPDAASRPR